MFERDYRDLAYVPRWGIIPVNHRQSVAEHSYYVALYALEIIAFYRSKGYAMKGLSENILTHALMHDRTESFMSDIPGPVKRSITDSEIRRQYEHYVGQKAYEFGYAPSIEAQKIIKLADFMDEYAYLTMEHSTGNAFPGMLKLRVSVENNMGHAAKNLPYLSFSEIGEMMDLFYDGLDKKKTLPEDCSELVA